MSQLLHDPLFYIGAEVLIIGILLCFVVPWSRDYKQWKAEQEEEAGRQQENELLDKLRNYKRRNPR